MIASPFVIFTTIHHENIFVKLLTKEKNAVY